MSAFRQTRRLLGAVIMSGMDKHSAPCLTTDPALDPRAPISITHVTRSFGDRRALDDVTFTARPGRVTGYLGPNGSGKSTTIRILLGLATADSGLATIAGRGYDRLPCPSREVGVLLENAGLHPSLTPVAQLKIAAAMSATPTGRIMTVLDEVGLLYAKDRTIKTFSQGMRQRLGIAQALLAEPRVLILDEPANGLDPEGMIWLRGLLRDHASRGTTVLVTSHGLAELQRFIDDIVILSNGRVLSQISLDQLPAGADLEAFYLSTLHTTTGQEAQS